MATAGRPTAYTDELADEICDLIASGQTLQQICDSKGLDRTAVVKWQRTHDRFGTNIARARSDQQEWWEDRITALNLSMDKDNWQYVNAQIRNIQWLMGKRNSRVYGDKISQEHSGPEGGPIKAEISVKFVKPGE